MTIIQEIIGVIFSLFILIGMIAIIFINHIFMIARSKRKRLFDARARADKRRKEVPELKEIVYPWDAKN